jgi:hypothetical protein
VFRLAIDGNALHLLAARAFHEPPNHRQLLGLISTGAALENLALRAARLGLTLEHRLEPDIVPGGVLARMEARPTDPRIGDALEGAIEQRQTNRRLRYLPTVLGEQRQSDLSAQAAAGGASVEWLDTKPRRRVALGLLRKAESERFCNPTLHQELFGSIRFDVGWRASAEQGLPPGALCLPPPERPAFTLLRHWSLQRVGNFFGLHKFVAFRGADLPCRLAPHLVAITTAGNGQREAVDAGRALQRTWLAATALGLSCQVFAAPGLYAQEAATDVRPLVRSQLRQGWEFLCPGRVVWLTMRIGFAAAAPIRASRPPASELWRTP